MARSLVCKAKKFMEKIREGTARNMNWADMTRPTLARKPEWVVLDDNNGEQPSFLLFTFASLKTKERKGWSSRHPLTLVLTTPYQH
jgi:hypothetical protein